MAKTIAIATLGAIGVFCTLLVIASGIYYAVTGEEQRTHLQAALFGPSFSQPPAYDEWQAAYTEHYYLALPISRCFPGVDLLTGHSSQQINMPLMIGLQTDGSYKFGEVQSAPPAMHLNNFQTSLIYLSDAVSRARLAAAVETGSSRQRMNFYEWLLVIIGAITTILISIKSMANEQTGRYVVIGVLAIVFSALGTAGASLNAFFSPNDAYAKSERTLLQLRKLHADMTAYVAAHTDDLCKSMNADGADEPKTKTMRDFWDRYSQIVNTPGNTATAPVGGAATATTLTAPISGKP